MAATPPPSVVKKMNWHLHFLTIYYFTSFPHFRLSKITDIAPYLNTYILEYLKDFLFYFFQNFAQVKNWRYQQYWGHLSLEKKKRKRKKIHFCQQDSHSFHNSEVRTTYSGYIFCVWVLSAPITVIQAKCCLFVESFDQKLTKQRAETYHDAWLSDVDITPVSSVRIQSTM